MSQLKESLNQISLRYILDLSEIKFLKKYELFKNIEETEYCCDKNELLLKFVLLAIEKFKKLKENILVKCFEWVKEELEMNLELKPDLYSLNKIEKMENLRPSMKMQLGWLKEYSTINKENFFLNMIGANKKLHRASFSNIFDYKSPIQEEDEDEFDNCERCYSIKEDIESNPLIMKLRSFQNLEFESNKFNIFEFEKIIGKEHILPAISVYIFNRNALFDIIPFQKFENCVYKIAQGYNRKNPYHTDLHAADMIQTIYVYDVFAKFHTILKLSDLDLFSIFFSAIIHDYGHPGLNNNYLIRTKDDLAIKYNDISVLENYHVSESFNIILKNPENNIFENLSEDNFRLCRKNIIECILGTDMTLHNKKYVAFKRRLKAENIKKGENIDKLFTKLDPINAYNLKVEFLSFILHAADISNPTKPLVIYKEWSQRCVEEFFQQGDLERKKGLPISFNCDRKAVSLPQSQLGFIDVIVSPLFTVLNEYFPQLSFTLDNLKKNFSYYKNIQNDKNKKDKKK